MDSNEYLALLQHIDCALSRQSRHIEGIADKCGFSCLVVKNLALCSFRRWPWNLHALTAINNADHEAQRQEFSAMLEKQLAAAFDRLRVELEAKIDASHRDLEAEIAKLEKQLWGAVVIVVTMFGIAVAIFGSLAR